jgi:hypothetical protein
VKFADTQLSMSRYKVQHTKSSQISKNFLVEFAAERVAFPLFYEHVKKQLSQEMLDFFFISFHYKHQLACYRLLNEKVIFDRFIKLGAKSQINLAEKLKKAVCEHSGPLFVFLIL